MLGMMIPHLLTTSLLLDHITGAVAIFIIPSWLILSQWHLNPRPTCWIAGGGNKGGGGGAGRENVVPAGSLQGVFIQGGAGSRGPGLG